MGYRSWLNKLVYAGLPQCVLRDLKESENIHNYCNMPGTVPCVHFYRVLCFILQIMKLELRGAE